LPKKGHGDTGSARLVEEGLRVGLGVQPQGVERGVISGLAHPVANRRRYAADEESEPHASI
jgi:hypothetical protein